MQVSGPSLNKTNTLAETAGISKPGKSQNIQKTQFRDHVEHVNQPASSKPAGPLSQGANPIQKSNAQDFMAKLIADERQVTVGLDKAMKSQFMTPQQLITLQARVIQYSQQMDVASKIVEKVTSAVKQAMSTQV